MKCPVCKGRTVEPVLIDGLVDVVPCKCCGGKGVVEPLNNEEWFDGLSTEEKAKFLFEHGVICCQFCKRDCIEIDYKTKECKYSVPPTYSYTGIIEWLKEKHESERK